MDDRDVNRILHGLGDAELEDLYEYLSNSEDSTLQVTSGGEAYVTLPPSPDHGQKRSAPPDVSEQQKSPLRSGNFTPFPILFFPCRTLLKCNFLAFFADANEDEHDRKLLSPLARKIKVTLANSVETLVKEGPKFPTALPPPSAAPEPCGLVVLPNDTSSDRLLLSCVRVGLAEVQDVLRKEPLVPERVIEAIEESTSLWEYKGVVSEELKNLISLVEG